METFSFSIPQHVIFGKGSLGKLPEAAKALGKNKALIISGPHLNRIGMVDKCRAALSAAGIGSAAFTETEGNPSTETVGKAVEAYQSSGADFIVAFGGGSPLDVAKAAGILAAHGGKITEYEGGGKVPGPVVPMIAIPTTAGTGSEVTSFLRHHRSQPQLQAVSVQQLSAACLCYPGSGTDRQRPGRNGCGMRRGRHGACAGGVSFSGGVSVFRYVRAESPAADREKSPRLRGEPWE